MKRDTHDLQQLVRRIRNRLWLALISRWTGLSLWLSAALLTTLGLVQRLHYPLPLAVPVLAVLLPPLAALVAALALRRPPWIDAARAADHQAKADSLLLSAWDLQRQKAEATGTAPLIMLQAQRQRPAWQARIDRYRPPGRYRFPTGASIACCIGAALLLLPPVTDPQDPFSATVTIPGTAVATHNPLAEIVRSVELAQADAVPPNRPAAPVSNPSDQGLIPAAPDPGPAAPPPSVSRPGDQDPDRTLTQSTAGMPPNPAAQMTGGIESDPADPRPLSGRGRNNAVGDKAGGGVGSEGDPASTPPPVASRAVAEVNVERRIGQGSDDYLNGQLSVAKQADRSIAAERSAAWRRPAERPASMPLTSALSPVQRNYVARYFHQLQSGSTR